MRITPGSIAERMKKVPVKQFLRELDTLTGMRTRPDGSRTLKGERQLTSMSISWADLAEATLGRDTVRRLRDTPYGITGGHAHLQFTASEDIGGGMGPGQFAGVNYFSTVLQRLLEPDMFKQYENPEFIGDAITELKPGIRSNNSRLPRYSPPTEKIKNLKPNEPIPMGSIDAEWVDTNPAEKFGQGLAVATESVLFEGQQENVVSAITDPNNGIGHQVGWAKEDRCLKALAGIHNTYKYGAADSTGDATGYDTYLTSGLYTNKSTLELVDTDACLNTAENVFKAMRHPRTGYPIQTSATRKLICMRDKIGTARRLARASSVEIGARDSTGVLVAAPAFAGPGFEIHTSERLRDLLTSRHDDAPSWTALTSTQAGHRWYYGDPKAAFHYRQVRPFQSWQWNMTQVPQLALSDTWMIIVGIEQGSVTVVEPRHVCNFIKDS